MLLLFLFINMFMRVYIWYKELTLFSIIQFFLQILVLILSVLIQAMYLFISCYSKCSKSTNSNQEKTNLLDI